MPTHLRSLQTLEKYFQVEVHRPTRLKRTPCYRVPTSDTNKTVMTATSQTEP